MRVSDVAKNHLAWAVARYALALAIVVGVGWQFYRILHQLDFSSLPFDFHLEWLVPAGFLYILAQLCWGAFWVRLLRDEGVPSSWQSGLRAYFVSQFGKYIPGKVMVVFIRVALLRREGFAALPVGVTATYETLTSMGSGALVGVLLLPYLSVLPVSVSEKSTLLLGFAALPAVLAVLNRVAVRIARKKSTTAMLLPSPSLAMLAQGLVHGVVGWLFLGVSFACVLKSVGAAPTGDDFAADLGAVSLAYVAGFVILAAPGGLGVREWVLQEVLTPRFTPALGPQTAEALAVIIALLLRLSWTVSEVLVAGGWCLLGRMRRQEEAG